MPTGYTAKVQSGEITEFKDFALTCARAFGALIHLRDEPLSPHIPDDIKGSDYHKERAADAEAQLAALDRLHDDEIRALATADNEKKQASHAAYVAERTVEKARYEAMLAKAREWTPPTPEHAGLKDFMIKQLEESIRFDCSVTFSAPEPLDATSWLNGRRKELQSNLAYHRKNIAADDERNAERIAWIKSLKQSLS
jgi:hypothetical protein